MNTHTDSRRGNKATLESAAWAGRNIPAPRIRGDLMGAYVARRFLLLPLVAFGVTVLIFALLQLVSPAQRAALFVTDVKQLAALPSIIRKYGLDQPVYVQYGMWLQQLAH